MYLLLPRVTHQTIRIRRLVRILKQVELPQELIKLPLIIQNLLLASFFNILLRKVFVAVRDLHLLVELIGQEVVLTIALIERRVAFLL